MKKFGFIGAAIYRMPMTRVGLTIALITLMVAAGTVITDFRSAGAQTTPIVPGAGASDFRPLFVRPEDISEGKRLAEASCTGCHGPNGISSTEGVPHLAGQRSPYVYIELKAYQSGTRALTVMGNVVKFLNDDALVKVAAYYATLEPAQPLTNSGPARRDPIQAGQAAAASCGGCHGETGVSKIAGMPSLVGLDPKYLVTAMQDYKSGQRNNGVMKALLANVSDANVNNIALYFALQKVARTQTPSPGDQAKGKAASAACIGCHGDSGVSGSPANPSLAGQDAKYLAVAMQAYKNGTRSDETMKGMVGSLDALTIADITAYYANQQPQQPNVRKPLTAAELAQRCDRCHGLNGNSTDPHFSALAGQRMDYLVKALRSYRTRERRSAEMAAMSDGLSDDDIENLAAHYAHQTARAVLYVIVPSR